jgi:hypothetical protein
MSVLWWGATLRGCASQPVAPPKEPPRIVVVADGGQPITSAELDELTRAFADRFVGLLYSACDTLRKDNPDPVQRREAQALLVDGSSNIYDIATNADAFTRLLDLVVITRLMSQVWVDDGRAAKVFGDRAAPLASALNHARTEIQALAARVLTVEQLAALDSLLVDWRAENPEMVHISFVRFSNFAGERGRSAASEVLAARGFFAEVGNAGQAVDEVRLLGERMFYQFKREPTLLRWQAAAAKDDLIATPEVAAALADMHRITQQIEQLPAHVAAEREAALAAIDTRIASTNATIAKIKDLVASLEPAAKSIDQALKSADALFVRYNEWDKATGDPARPFDIREYTELVKESAATAQRLKEALNSSNDLLKSPDWQARIDEWNRAADGRIEVMAEQSHHLVNTFFQRLYIAAAVLFGSLVLYRVVSILLTRWLTAHRSMRGSTPSGQPFSQGKR